MAADKQQCKETLINELRETCVSCVGCDLHKTRISVVFARGSIAAPIFLVGEAPGEEEDSTGMPFVGRSGILLDRLLETHMGLNVKDDVYITNIVKCRPPENRVPSELEIAACQRWIKHQIDIIRPECIITLGASAAKWALGMSMDKISKIRGQWQEFHGIPLMPTFHPSYILRTGDKHKSEFASDLALVTKRMEALHRESEVPFTGSVPKQNIISASESNKANHAISQEKFEIGKRNIDKRNAFEAKRTDLTREEVKQMTLDWLNRAGK